MNNKLDCAIVRDLLPLYQDGVVSEVTKNAVQEHLEICSACHAELQALGAWEPKEEAPSTREGFALFRRKLNRKRFLTALVSIILTTAVLVSAGVVAHQIPLVPITEQELTVHRTYRYEVDGQPYFLVLYEVPAYTGYTNGGFEVIGDEKTELGPLTLQLKWKKTVLARTLDWTKTDFWVFNAEGMNAGKEIANFAQLKHGDRLLWSEESGATDVPEYVYVLHGYYTGQTEEPLNAFFEDVEKGYLGVCYQDGRRVVWDLDGHVLADDYPDERGNYPNF